MKTEKILRHIFFISIISLFSNTVWAEDIIIGKGSGIIWSGQPFNVTIITQHPLGGYYYSYGDYRRQLVAIGPRSPYTDSPRTCYHDAISMATVNGILGYSLAKGVILVPRAQISAHYMKKNNQPGWISGTVGYPSTHVTTDEGLDVSDLNPVSQYRWCFNPAHAVKLSEGNWYQRDIPHTTTVNISGDWVIIADGTQQHTNSKINIPIIYGKSAQAMIDASTIGGMVPILPASTIKISNIDCRVITPTNLDFGRLYQKAVANSELARISTAFNVSCSQTPQYDSANINVQFQALTGLHNGNRGHLSLNNNDGYITGEIDQGVTGSGSCSANTGLPFDNSELKIGQIKSSETSKNFSNQITWRLCQGNNLTPGPVNAAAEMLITLN